MEKLTQNINSCLVICSMENKFECAYFTGNCILKCQDAQRYDKLAAYEDAEEQGRLVVLPCKAGDFIYQLEETGIVRRWVETIEIFEDGIFLHIGRGGCPNIDTFGKTVFLTREEAEAALNKKG